MKTERVFIGLGSNLGDRVVYLRDAVHLMSQIMQIEKVSQLYVSAPPGFRAVDAYVNAVLQGTTELKPLNLLHALRDIEHQLGRRRGVVYGPRPIDLDILFYGAAQIESLELTIPHPRIAERAFVLKPLAEIAPNHLHPVVYYTMQQMLQDVDDAEQVKPYTPELASELTAAGPAS